MKTRIVIAASGGVTRAVFTDAGNAEEVEVTVVDFDDIEDDDADEVFEAAIAGLYHVY